MAAEFVASAAANAAGNLATEYASPYLSYFFRFGKIVENFKNQRKELELKKDRVKNDVDEAVRQTEVIEKDVEDWLTRAEKELEETQSLEDEIERDKCFKWCPSWGWRYCLSKKVANKTLNISKLLETSNFSRVGHRAPLQGIEFLLSKDFMDSESSRSAFNGIMKALNRDDVKKIGLYGMPGVGKTTLAKEVGKQATEQKLFDKVMIVTMSQTPNVNNIQDKIAEILGLTFKTNTEGGKAEELWRRLKGEKKFLIIVDDIWERFDLQTIGIPCGGEHDGCKILLTTRLQQVCIQIGCQKEIQLNILSENEAWALFKENAGLEDVTSTLNDVAKEVAGECKGLPLAIVTMAKALKGESLDGWRAANQRLKDSRHLDNQDVCEDIYRLLKLSYDYLKEDNIQSCFLLCSLFPEDYDISIEILTICGIGVGLFSNIYSMEDLRREIRVALRKLQKSGLLLETDDEKSVKMHDVVRDFAHWLTSKGENMFMVKDGLTEWPMVESFGCYTAIALFNCSNINNFPDKVEFSKLKTLILVGEDSLEVPSTIFEEMKALQVLLLIDVVVSLEGLQSLTNLRTLCFEECKLENISSSLRNMRNLEILVLSNTNIHELPEELVELSRLKSLYLCHNDGEQQINSPPNLLSRMASLQELYVTSENNVNLLELNSLSRLTALSLRVSTNQCFQENFVFPKLQRYAIGVNNDLDVLEGLTFRTLKIKNLSSSLSAFKDLFCNVKKLTLENVTEQKNIVPDIAKEGVNELTSLKLKSCEDMEFLIDTTGEQGPATAFSNLVELNMEEMTCLKELCHGPPPTRFLLKLETLTIEDCCELIIAVPATLQNLKQVRIECCKRLQVVFQLNGLSEKKESRTAPLLSNLTSLDLGSLPELEIIWKLEPSHHAIASLQSLKFVTIRYCNKLKSIFSPCLAQSLLHLQELKISYCDGLEQVFGFAQEDEMAELEENLSNLTWLKLSNLPKLRCIWKGPTHCVNLSSLKTMTIWACDELAYLFSTPLAQTLVHLEELDVWSCNSLEHLIKEAENEDEICVSNMKNHYPLCWPKLKTLRIRECKSLKYVFPNTLAQGLPCLEFVKIEDCVQLIQVFNMEKENDGQDIVLPGLGLQETLSNLTCLELESLPKIRCIWKGSTDFVNLRSLKNMRIEHCDKLAYLFSATHAQTLVHLEELTIWACDSLKQLITEAENEDEICVSNMQNLKTLEIMNCKNLKYVFPITLAQGLPNLKSVKIIDCLQLMQLFNMAKEKDGQDIVLPRLQFLQLGNLPNLSSFCPEKFVMSLSLEKFKVRNCPLLNHFGNQQGLVMLLAELEDVELYAFKELLCNAKKLTLKRVNPVSNVDPEGFNNELGFLQLDDEKALECLFDTTECHFSTKVFFNLVELVIEGMGGFRMLCNGRFPKGFLGKLEYLKTESCMDMVSLSPMAVLQNLKEVRVINCGQLQEVFQIDELLHDREENQAPLLSNLTWLELQRLPELKRMWKGPTHYVSLQRLMVAEITYCNGLKYLFSPSLAQSLVLLEKLKIKHCEGLEHIIVELERDDDIEHLIREAGNEDEIVSNMQCRDPLCWPKLKTLEIRNCGSLKYVFPITLAHGLPCLESIDIIDCPQIIQVFSPTEERDGNDILLKLPSLRYLTVKNCPQLTFFIVQAQLMEKLYLYNVGNSCQLCNTHVPILNQDYIAVGNHEEVFHVQGGYSFSSIKKLELKDLSEVRIIWKDPAQVVTLEYLTILELIDCKKLIYIFSRTTARSLSQLVHLVIQGCEELDQIINTEDPVSSSSNGDTGLQPISFPNLTDISVEDCKKLKSLFPLGSARSLPKLECLIVKGNSKLEQVFELEDEAEVTAEKEIKLDKLGELSLKELPGLIDFCLKGYHFVLSALSFLTVEDCPKMTTGFFIDSKNSVHCKTEIPRLVEQDATGGCSTAQNAVLNKNIYWILEEEGELPHYMDE